MSSLSAILLDDDYYHVLLEGKSNANGLSVLRPEYLILFKAKAYLDLKQRKENGENVDSKNGTISLEEKQVPWLMLSLTVLHMTAIRSTSQALMLSTIDPCGRYMDWINQFGNSISLIVAHSVWTGGSRHTGRAALPHKNIQILMVTVLFLYFILLWIY